MNHQGEHFRRSYTVAGALVALMVCFVALIAHGQSSPQPSPPPDAAKGRRGLVNVAAEQVFAGRKVFDGGVTIQADFVVDGGAMFRGTPSAFSGVVQIDQRAQTNAAGLVLLNGGAGDNGIFFEGGPSSGGMSISTTSGLFGPRSTNRTQLFSVNSDVYSPAGSPAFDFTGGAYSSGVLARWRSGTVPIMEHYIDGGTTFDGGVNINGGLIVTGTPGGTSLTAGVGTALGSANSNLGCSALWLGNAAGISPTLSNTTLSRCASASGPPVGLALQDGSTITIASGGVGGVVLQAQGSTIASASAGGAFSPALNVTYAVYMNGGANAGIQWGGSSQGMRLTTEVADGASSTGLLVNTTRAWSNTGARLVKIQTNSVSVMEVDAFGRNILSGTDSSGTPGAATINKPRGISAIAIGASTVTITNSLAATTSHIMITPLARDTTCKELAVTTRSAGSFVVSCTANATAAVVFAWEVGGLL